MKLLIPLKLSTVWSDVKIAPPATTIRNAEHDALLSIKVVFPVNIRLLLLLLVTTENVIAFELIPPCQSNVGVIHYK